MNPRLTAALLAGRGAAWLARRSGHGGGTVLPGHVIPRIDPHAVSTIAARLSRGSILVSGTNGKTTTTRMISQILSRAGLVPIHNRSGANLMTGIASAVAAKTDLNGEPHGDVGVFEADEAHVPIASDALQPRVLALLNVFRDQLDRYGEVELVAKTWQRAVQGLPRQATLVLNADDPIIAQLGETAQCSIVYFGVDTQSVGAPELPHEADKRLCHRCGARIHYAWSYYGHIGHYACPTCGWQRPQPGFTITRLLNRPDGRLDLSIDADGDQFDVTLPLAGVYNAYNAVAAAAVCRSLGVTHDDIVVGLETFKAVFGRQERVAFGRGQILLDLVKNPVGFNQVLQALFGPDLHTARPESEPETLMVIAINDLFADGTDISWLWDVDFELLVGQNLRILCTGLRAHDMALRLKYAEIPMDRVQVDPRIGAAVEQAARAAAAGSSVVICPTYTAMLDIRADLQRRGAVAPFWEN